MSEIAPPSPVAPPTLPAPQRLAILLAPPALTDIPPGTKLDVTVGQLLDNGQVRLTSALGDITLNAGRLALNTGDKLLLQFLGGGSQPQARLSLPDGTQLPSKTAAQVPLSATGGNIAGTQAPSATPTLQIGSTVQATLLQSLNVGANATVLTTTPTGTITASGTTGIVQPGVNAAPTVLSGTPGTVQTPPQPTTGAASTSPSGIPGQVPTRAAATPAGVQTVPTGSLLTLKVLGLQVPASPPESFAPPPSGQQISLAPSATLNGVATGRQGVTHTVVQTPVGAVSLPTATPFPPGTQFQFEIVRLTPSTAGSGINAAAGQSHLLAASTTWPSLDDTMTALREIAPGAHAQVTQAAIPRADAQLTTNIMFFLSALRGGDIRTWMGDGPVRVLERARPDLSGRLRDDLGQMTRINDDPATGEWRMLAMPFMNDGDIERIRMLLRDDQEDEDDDEQGKGGTRFVIDLNLTQLGHIQLDGLVGNQGKRLDLVVRSDEPMPPAMKADIRELYVGAIEVTGIEGSVGFQAAPGNFVEIVSADADDTAFGDGMVV